MLLEIAVFNSRSAIIAAEAGADRIELCENPHDGGTTPSFGSLKTVREKIDLPVFPIIRPRGGDFLYEQEELEVIKKDILLCKDLGYDGIVIGILNREGAVDKKQTRRFTELAYPLEVTFHRAFDRTTDPLQALEDIIACGCQRILTSGQVPDAHDGKELIKQLIEQANERIIIMPGSGVRSNNIAAIANYTGAEELHSSARKIVSSEMRFIKTGMEETLNNISVDADEIRSMKKELRNATASEK
jgi:copper homeostasis protein